MSEREERRRGIAIVSPHRDDAAFSCGILMRACAAAGVPVTMVNLFTVSDYAPYQPGTAEETTALRREEDRAVLRRLGGGVEMMDLELNDAPLRLHIGADTVVSGPISAERFAEEVRWLTPRLSLLREFDCVLLPMGIGGHVDHCIAREAGRVASIPERTGFYEDLPYSARAEAAERERYVEEIGVRGEWMTVRRRDGVAVKTELARLYPSQIAPEVVEEIAAYAEAMGGGERMLVAAEVKREMMTVLGGDVR